MSKPNWKNHTIWTGDNLPIMRGMNSESVDLIYLDPPFNSNQDYAAPIGSEAAGAAFKDTWTLDDVDRLWILLLKDKDPVLYHVIEGARLVHGNGMASYLSMMAPRMVELRRVLKSTGSLYLHCDPTASHYLKMLIDAIFGLDHFQNEIIWQKIRSSKAQTIGFGSVHDTIFAYRKTASAVFRKLYTPLSDQRVARHYGQVESDTGRQYGLYDFTQSGQGNPRRFGARVIDPPAGKHWIWEQDRIDAAMSEGRIVFTSKNMVRVKRYLDNSRGNPMEDVWIDIPPINSMAQERIGYPTQKPLALLERIIQASSNEGDTVFDPFCGCATACVAAERHHRQWLGVDISEKAAELVQVRIRKEVDLFHNFKPIHRTDQPQRTDLGKLPPPSAHKDLLYGQQSGKCGGCMVMFHKRNLTMDHIVPQADGGTDHIENLWLLCGACNSSKGTKSQAEFLKDRVKRGESIEWLL